MKKRSVIVAMLCSMCLAVSTPIPAMADASKVVTLGADLTDEQKNTMMNYFKADASQVQVISVTNQDEHNHLDNIAPQEQIGSHTLSCLCKTYTVRRHQGAYSQSELCNM